MTYRPIVALICLIAMPSAAGARTWRILSNGSGDASTIQAGIDSASNGDTVLVNDGTYRENISVIDKDLILRSVHGSELTILDGSGRQDAVLYLSGLTRQSVVDGFTITGGVGHPRGSVYDGGGVHLANRSSPIIRNNFITGNGAPNATFFGGGIVAWTDISSPLIEHNVFSLNTARLGGAISLSDGNGEICNNLFRENSCPTDGGGIYAFFNSGFVTICNNQYWNNYAGDHGGAIDIGGTALSKIDVVWNLFVGNQAEGSGTGDTGAGGAIHLSSVEGSITNNTIVEGDVPNEVGCSGGGISLESTTPNLDISRNIIALNHDCGIACRFTIQNTLGPNLLWMNENGDLGFGLGSSCPSEWAASQIFADPMFCGPEFGNYSVSIESPALTGSTPMGVWTSPGCGPGVTVRPSTWGRLKALYR